MASLNTPQLTEKPRYDLDDELADVQGRELLHFASALMARTRCHELARQRFGDDKDTSAELERRRRDEH